MTNDIPITPIFVKNHRLSKQYRFLINEGSSRSSKTFSILQYLIFRCLLEKIIVTISRVKLTWLKKTVLVDFIEILENHYNIRVDYRNFNKTEMIFRFANGSRVNFIGSEEKQKLHGLKQNIYYGNEYDEASYKQFEQANIRTTDLFIIDYNPKYTEHWIYDKVETRDDAILIKSTFRDNQYLSKNIVREIEALKDIDEISWKIYGLGERAAYKGLVYQNFKLCDKIPDEYEWRCLGEDAGFNDPYTLIDVYFTGQAIYVDELVYQSHLTDNEIIGKLKDLKIEKNQYIVADSAAPDMISAQRIAGYAVWPVKKGAGSILAGIKLLKQYPIFVTKRSRNIIKEKNMYRWKVHPQTEQFLDEPEDNNNHTLDAIRYVATFKGLRLHTMK